MQENPYFRVYEKKYSKYQGSNKGGRPAGLSAPQIEI